MSSKTFIQSYEKLAGEFTAVLRPLFENLRAFFYDHPFIKIIFLNILSAVLLVLAFPKTDFWILAWAALVPFLFSLEEKSLKASFAIGYFFGVLFFSGVVYWLIHVTGLGMVLMVLYLSTYFGCFALLYYWSRKFQLAARIVLLSCSWAALEFIKANLMTGFNWAALAHSQYKNLLMIQVADITGMFGVSFLVVMVNVLIKECISLRTGFKSPSEMRRLKNCFIVVSAVLFLAAFYGKVKLAEPAPSNKIIVAVAQGNIDQELKWNRQAWNLIMEKYQNITRLAVAKSPDLIVWPETAFPGFYWEAPSRFLAFKQFVSGTGIPLLTGIVDYEDGKYFNSAVLLDRKGRGAGKYNKLHLVPFGEYIPFREIFPFLEQIVPIDDFTPGGEHTVFSLENKAGGQAARFSVLICFEDAVSQISRKFVQNGAQFLINISNDAWFKRSKASYMHVQSSVFRAVENRRSLVRATNTGVSALINPRGAVTQYVEDSRGERMYVRGFFAGDVELGEKITVYTKFGDVFTYLCFGCILCLLVIKRFKLLIL